MPLVTANGWVLTEYTERRLMESFPGRYPDLAMYVLQHRIVSEPVASMIQSHHMFTEPVEFHLGAFTLIPDKEGVVAYKGDKPCI